MAYGWFMIGIWWTNEKWCMPIFSQICLMGYRILNWLAWLRFWKNVTRDTPSNDSDHLCQKKKNPSRTVNATERTRFSKSRPNDLEDIGQGQGSSHATHPLMLLIICTKYWKNPSWTVDATGRTRKVNGQTDRQTDGQTDRQTDKVNPIYPP